MAEMNERLRNDALEALDRLEALMKLAKANFPRTSEISIETGGYDPKASMSMPWYLLKTITDAGRRALSEGGE